MIDHFHGEYRFLSNFFAAPVAMYGLLYPTTEHAFQAAKSLDPNERERIRLTKTPGQAKRMGRSVTLRPDWNEFRLIAMRELLRRKFAIPYLREHLVATHPQTLVEGNTWGDRFWGVCDRKGENHLGRLLVEIREELMASR